MYFLSGIPGPQKRLQSIDRISRISTRFKERLVGPRARRRLEPSMSLVLANSTAEIFPDGVTLEFTVSSSSSRRTQFLPFRFDMKPDNERFDPRGGRSQDCGRRTSRSVNIQSLLLSRRTNSNE